MTLGPLMIIAGEASADAHGAGLVRALRRRQPDLVCFGVGGPALRDAGVEILVDAAALAVVGITEVAVKFRALSDALGRVRRERWGPRTVDLDLLVYGNVIMRTPSLELPHPRLAERDFVLQPLKDIAPELLIPGTGKTVSQLVHERPPAGGVRLYLASWYHRA